MCQGVQIFSDAEPVLDLEAYSVNWGSVDQQLPMLQHTPALGGQMFVDHMNKCVSHMDSD